LPLPLVVSCPDGLVSGLHHRRRTLGAESDNVVVLLDGICLPRGRRVLICRLTLIELIHIIASGLVVSDWNCTAANFATHHR